MKSICNEFMTLSEPISRAGNAVVLKRTLSKHFGSHFKVLQKFNGTFAAFIF